VIIYSNRVNKLVQRFFAAFRPRKVKNRRKVMKKERVVRTPAVTQKRILNKEKILRQKEKQIHAHIWKTICVRNAGQI